MLAKRIFYVSGSIMALAIAYQLGVTAAHGQAGGTLAAVTDGNLGSAVATTSGNVYYSLYGSNTPAAPHWTFKGTIPASAPVVDIVDAGYAPNGIDDVLHAFDASGNFYLSMDTGRTWSRRGSVFGGATPAIQESWERSRRAITRRRQRVRPRSSARRGGATSQRRISSIERSSSASVSRVGV